MSYQLYYFNSRGLAEPIRMILKLRGVEFEDIRAPVDPEKPTLPIEIKEKCTWGQVPLIEFEGKKLAQSLAITRYLANKFNLVPKDEFEAALCDEYVDSSRELYTSFYPYVLEKDEAKRSELLILIKKTAHEKYLSKLETIVKTNAGQRLVGKDLTWADIYLAHIINNIELCTNFEILKNYPALKSHNESVFSIPQIKDWIETRPETQF